MSSASPLEARLAHLALRSPDPERASRFYERVVGLSVDSVRADGAVELGWGRGHRALELVDGERGICHLGLEVPDPGHSRSWRRA